MKNVTIDDVIYCAEVESGCRNCEDCRLFGFTDEKLCNEVTKFNIKILKEYKEKTELPWKKSMLARFLKSE